MTEEIVEKAMRFATDRVENIPKDGVFFEHLAIILRESIRMAVKEKEKQILDESLKSRRLLSHRLKMTKKNPNQVPEMRDKFWDSFIVTEKKQARQQERKRILGLMRALLNVPCCHTSGMHDPRHFQKNTFICEGQKKEAFDRLCKILNVKPKALPSKKCFWCFEYDYSSGGKDYSRSPVEEKFEDAEKDLKPKLKEES